MATCQTNRWVSTSPYVKLTVTETASTATTSTLSYTLQYISDTAASTSNNKSYMVDIDGEIVAEGSFNINGLTGTRTICSGTTTITKSKANKTIECYFEFFFNLTWSGVYAGQKDASTTISIAAKDAYSIFYNANGGTGAPSRQLKWYGEEITLSSTKPTRTGYAFQGWGTSAADTTVDYNPGVSYTANAAITLYAIWKANTYTVTYNANGGSGAPANQTKTYGENLTLSSSKPTRTNYTFKGWAKSASGAVSYQPGGTYTSNAAITLYAVWELSYVLPKIYNVSAGELDVDDRYTDENGVTKNEITVSFNCETTYEDPEYNISFYDETGEIPSATTSGYLGYDASINKVNIISKTTLNIDKSYTIKITIKDSGGSSTATTTFTGNIYPIDVLAGGMGVSFGGPASLEDTAHFQWDVRFDRPVYGMVKGLGRLPKIEEGSDLNNYRETFGAWAIYSNDDAKTISNMPKVYFDSTNNEMVGRAGILEVYSSTGEGLRSAEWSYVRQKFTPYLISCPIMEREITRDNSNGWTYGEWYATSNTPVILYDGAGSTGEIQLSQPVDNFKYLEIYFTDNNGLQGGYTKLHRPADGSYISNKVCLYMVEPNQNATLIRRSMYLIADRRLATTTIGRGYIQFNETTITKTVSDTNYIKITRVVGYY